MMHIEDQYTLKRCGHLGGKGLDDLHGYLITMKAANLAASLFNGVNRDGAAQNVNFVSRTDALSAEFIQYSANMHSPHHPDHPFIDWDRKYFASAIIYCCYYHFSSLHQYVYWMVYIYPSTSPLNQVDFLKMEDICT
jgi:isocitrate lyase